MKRLDATTKRILKGPLSSAGVIHLAEPHWDPNSGFLAFWEHYRRCIEKGLKKGVPKQKNLNMVLPVQ